MVHSKGDFEPVVRVFEPPWIGEREEHVGAIDLHEERWGALGVPNANSFVNETGACAGH